MSRPWPRGAAAARREAQALWSKQEKERDAKSRKEKEKEQEAGALKTARLRELRLAKEAADKEAAKAAPTPPASRVRRPGPAIPERPEKEDET